MHSCRGVQELFCFYTSYHRVEIVYDRTSLVLCWGSANQYAYCYVRLIHVIVLGYRESLKGRIKKTTSPILH